VLPPKPTQLPCLIITQSVTSRVLSTPDLRPKPAVDPKRSRRFARPHHTPAAQVLPPHARRTRVQSHVVDDHPTTVAERLVALRHDSPTASLGASPTSRRLFVCLDCDARSSRILCRFVRTVMPSAVATVHWSLKLQEGARCRADPGPRPVEAGLGPFHCPTSSVLIAQIIRSPRALTRAFASAPRGASERAQKRQETSRARPAARTARPAEYVPWGELGAERTPGRYPLTSKPDAQRPRTSGAGPDRCASSAWPTAGRPRASGGPRSREAEPNGSRERKRPSDPRAASAAHARTGRSRARCERGVANAVSSTRERVRATRGPRAAS
jgi:hypothetical protein